MQADLLKLIAYGKVMEDDNKLLKDYSIKEGDFLVVMVSKVCISYIYLSNRQSQLLSQRKMQNKKSNNNNSNQHNNNISNPILNRNSSNNNNNHLQADSHQRWK